jgi:amino acid transporter
LPFKAAFGIWGSYVCLLINVLALVASFYVALYPVGGPYLSAKGFFQSYLAGPFLIFLYLIWKVYSWFKRPEDRPFYVKIKNIDIYTGMREEQLLISGADVPPEQRRYIAAEKKRLTPQGHIMRFVRNII